MHPEPSSDENEVDFRISEDEYTAAHWRSEAQSTLKAKLNHGINTSKFNKTASINKMEKRKQ